MTAELVILHESTLHDVPAKLRKIAEDVENNVYGPVGCCGVVVMGDQINTFGMGPDSEGPSVAMVLYAGFMQLARMIEDHGK
jgi:hypothetical protein